MSHGQTLFCSESTEVQGRQLEWLSQQLGPQSPCVETALSWVETKRQAGPVLVSGAGRRHP